jgi:hypothetical protein
MTLTVTEREIELTGEHSNAKLDWSMVTGVSERENAILIHMKPVGFQLVPKGQLPQEDVRAFKSFLQLHAPGKVKLAKA